MLSFLETDFLNYYKLLYLLCLYLFDLFHLVIQHNKAFRLTFAFFQICE